MPAPPDDTDISIVEELDPEPPREGLSRTREFLLGLLIVTAVLAWGGWESWRQEHGGRNYRLGQQAESRHDWDAARAYYADAAGFKDADARGAEAARLVTERDQQFKLAEQASTEGKWAVALQAIQAVRHIQPNYKHAAWLDRQITEQVYNDALMGTVVQREHAIRPGLYYRDQDAWVWLQSSDRWSSVLGTGDPNHIVYDVPGDDWKPPAPAGPTPTPEVLIPGSPELQGRRLLVASKQGQQFSFIPLGMDPAQYDYYIWGERGVWGLRYMSRNPLEQHFGVRSGFTGHELVYQPLGDPIASTVSLPGPGWIVMDLSPDGGQILLADVSGYEDAESTSHLYVANANGSSPQLLYSHKGGFVRAEFSPKGDKALLIAYTTLDDYQSEVQSVVLLDVKGNVQPLVLVEKAHKTAGVPAQDLLLLPSLTSPSAHFLQQGQHSGKLLLVEAEWQSPIQTSFLTVYDPYRSDLVPIRTRVESKLSMPEFLQPWFMGEGDSNLYLIWQNVVDRGPQGFSMTVICIKRDGSATAVELPLGDEERLASARIREGYLLFRTEKYRDGRRSGSTGTNSVSLHDLAGVDPSTKRIITGPVQPVAASTSLGPRMFAYIKNGELHAVTLDGEIDLPLDDRVVRFFDYSRSNQNP